MQLIGKHESAVRCIVKLPEQQCIASGGWDSAIKIWDLRSNGYQAKQKINTKGKVYAMSSDGDQLGCCTSEKYFSIYDVKNLSTPLYEQKLSTMSELRCIALLADQYVAIGSNQSKVHINFANDSKKQFTFICHKGNIVQPTE